MVTSATVESGAWASKTRAKMGPTGAAAPPPKNPPPTLMPPPTRSRSRYGWTDRNKRNRPDMIEFLEASSGRSHFFRLDVAFPGLGSAAITSEDPVGVPNEPPVLFGARFP